MTAIPLVNQSIATLLPERRSQPAPENNEPAFDRSLKDADTRLDQSKPTDRSSESYEGVPDREATKQTASQTETDTHPHEDDDATVQGSDTSDDKTQETDEADQPTETDAPDSDVEPAINPASNQDHTTVDVSTTETQNQAVSEILTNASEKVIAQTVLLEQQTVSQQSQTTSEQPVLVEAATTLANTSAGESGQGVSKVATKPNQDKLAEVPLNSQNQSAQPSATTERIELVSESRQNDSQQTDSRDSSQQQNASGNSDSLIQQTTINTTGSGSNTQPVMVDATAASVQPSVSVSGEQTAPAAAAGQSAAGMVKADNADNTQLNTARIARGLQNAVQQKGGAVTLRLTPPEMGTVRIQLQIHNGTVNAQFHAETESTRSLLNQQISQLRTSLEHQGLSVDRLSVQTMQQTSNTNLQHESQSDRDGQPNDGRSRGGFNRQGGDQRQGSDDTQSQQEFDQALSNAA